HRAARRRVVERRGELERGIAGERQQRLYAALAEAALAHDQRAALVLQRTRDDFARRGRAGIDKHDHRHARSGISAIDALRLVVDRIAPAAAPLRDDLAFGEEQVAERHRLVERAAGILAQVEHQAVEAATILTP